MTIRRYSSRAVQMAGLLPKLLSGARGYDRIAGYFRSSILEVAGEALESMAEGAVVRVICNSDLEPLDVATAHSAKMAMYREWRAGLPADLTAAFRARLEKLYWLLTNGRLRIRVLPDAYFGLVHGKAGVVTFADGRRQAFLGSVNESRRAWQVNYELLWLDDSPDAVEWVQAEFEALWNHPGAVPLSDAVLKDIERVSRRYIMTGVAEWKADYVTAPAAATIELPVYAKEQGLWAHQKTFVVRAFAEHRANDGARLLLADQVGLGKTIQLGLAAKLMLLWGGGKGLVVAPKPLLLQWRDELWSLLRFPCAIWTGKGWEDEHGVLHPDAGPDGMRRCPRRLGIVSAGLLQQSPEAQQSLLGGMYEVVIVDEAHKARRSNIGPTHRKEIAAKPNILLAFLSKLAPQAKSLLLATATPVQLDAIEAWDLLMLLNSDLDRSGRVLGDMFSRWRIRPRDGLDYIMGRAELPDDSGELWEWLRNPLPPASEGPAFQQLRMRLGVHDAPSAPASAYDRLKPPGRKQVHDLAREMFADHNPYIRSIIRRTRAFLETERDPETHEPYLKPVRVRLYGEADADAVLLPGFLRDAYETAELFCQELGKRPKLNSGILKTILLRRIGSSIAAGKATGEKLLGPVSEDGIVEEADEAERSSLAPFSEEEERLLKLYLAKLRAASGLEDPKFKVVERLLLHGVDGGERWLNLGCIVFSQYFASADSVAATLSRRLPDEPVALYSAEAVSGVYRAGSFARLDREAVKAGVRTGDFRLLVGTDAASEGLNLQRLGSLINLDLPWNPTRLEQRKGRIQRIGQLRDEVLLYNLRYRDSVEDRVHQLLSSRLQAITGLFGQLPDTLEDVWVMTALRSEEEAHRIIDEVPTVHPFIERYDRVEPVDWESCAAVLDSETQADALRRGW